MLPKLGNRPCSLYAVGCGDDKTFFGSQRYKIEIASPMGRNPISCLTRRNPSSGEFSLLESLPSGDSP